MNQVDPAWEPRPPKSAFRLWSRYVFQWLWGVLAEPHEHQQQYGTHLPHPAQRPQQPEQAPPQQPVPGAAPSAPIPAGKHSIAGEIGERIRLWGRGRQEVGLAWIVVAPEAPEKADKSSRPPFTIHGGAEGGLLCSVQPSGHGTYDVFAADGVSLARIMRRPGRLLLGPRRVRWTVQLSGTTQPITGKVGTWYSWLSYYVFAPLWAPFWLCIVAYTLLGGGSDDMRVTGPSRTLWRSPGSGTAMEYRGVNKVYHLEPQHVDYRVAYAQAVLHSRDR